MAGTYHDTQYAVVWPRGQKAVDIKPMAQRLTTLEGKTIGLTLGPHFSRR